MIRATIQIIILCFLLTSAKAEMIRDMVLREDISAEEMGLEIATRADKYDNGYRNYQADMQMVLRNKYGQETIRKMKMKVLETKKDGYGEKSITTFQTPMDVAGTAFLSHSKINESDDQWLYLPALKRVKRISSKSKSGSFMGSEFSYEDTSAREADKYNYKYIGMQPCDYQELNCYVVEAYPEYKYSGYTKQVVWYDEEVLRPIKIEFYDRKNSLLKTLKFSEYKRYLGKFWKAHKMAMENHQNGKSTDLLWDNFQFRVRLRESDFEPSRLKQLR